jgi:hypothetical protein
MLIILINTVAKKRIDVKNATFLSLFLFIRILTLPKYGDSISEVIRSIMAIVANNRLMPQKFKGKFTV